MGHLLSPSRALLCCGCIWMLRGALFAVPSYGRISIFMLFLVFELLLLLIFA